MTDPTPEFTDDQHYDTACDDRPGCDIAEHHALEDVPAPAAPCLDDAADAEHLAALAAQGFGDAGAANTDNACPDEWQPAHAAGSHPDHCRTCSAAAVSAFEALPLTTVDTRPGALPAAAVSDVAPLTFDDVRHLFDLAVDTPLVCSGSFDTDDVDVLRRVAVFLGTDPNAITPDEFVSQYPHPHKPRPVHDRTLKKQDNRQSGYGLRDETAEETTARVAEERADLTCWAGPYVRRCGKLADDPIHTGAGS